MEEKPLRFAVYIRCSTEMQEDSPHTQRVVLQDWVTRKGHAIWEFFVEPPVTAEVPISKRPVASKLFALVQAKDRPFDAILALRLDRIFRDDAEESASLAYLVKHHCRIFTPDGEVKLDTPEQRAMVKVLGVFRQLEREQTGDRIKDKRLADALEGKWRGSLPPLGYKWDSEAKRLVAGERLGDLLTVFETFIAAGGSSSKTAKIVNSLGIRPVKAAAWNGDTIRKLITRPTYRRQIVYKGRTVEASASIDEIVPKRLLDAALNLIQIGQKIPNRSKNAFAAYSGLIRCGSCGSSIFVSARKKIDFKQYACTGQARYGICPQPSLSGCKLDYYVGEAVSRLLKEFLAVHAAKVVSLPTHSVREAECAQLSAEKKRLTEVYIVGAISREDFDRRFQRLEAKIADCRSLPEPLPITEEQAREWQSTAGEEWHDHSEEIKRGILLHLRASLVLTVRGRKDATLLLHSDALHLTVEVETTPRIKELITKRNCVHRKGMGDRWWRAA